MNKDCDLKLRASIFLLVGVLVLSACTPAAAAVGSTSQERPLASNNSVSTVPLEASQATSSATARTIELTQELERTPEMPGEIVVTLQYSMPADVVDVLSRMNTQNDPVTGPEFREMVRQIGGDDTVTLTDRYTSTREIP